MTDDDNNSPVTPQPNWEKARPHRLPRPTYWPFFLALGFAFVFWGLLTSWIILAAGICILAVALYGWIELLRHE
ncbi:MAG TPA: hypothetical protein VHC47_06770 [Mucilaginibacter sp.]|nr:hypothetical protein [Mucilaginibacter sp.]